MAIKVLSICYDPRLLHPRHVALKQVGVCVDSVLGTTGAKNLNPAEYEIVIIGHAAPLAEREQLLRWLRKKAPRARIIALQSSVASAELRSVDVTTEAFNPDECVRAVLACASPDYRSFAV